MRRVLTVLLLLMVVVQLGPACGFASAGTVDSMNCCQTKCPPHSSRQPNNCCQLSVTSDKAVTQASVAPRIKLARMGVSAIVSEPRMVRALSLIAYRSPAPPPQALLDILCSRQI